MSAESEVQNESHPRSLLSEVESKGHHCWTTNSYSWKGILHWKVYQTEIQCTCLHSSSIPDRCYSKFRALPSSFQTFQKTLFFTYCKVETPIHKRKICLTHNSSFSEVQDQRACSFLKRCSNFPMKISENQFWNANVQVSNILYDDERKIPFFPLY